MDNKCTYCNGIAEVKEHVIPVVWLSFSRSYDTEKNWIVPACNRCNQLAGATICFSIPEKAKVILKKYRTKYKKILKYPEWTEQELDELEYSLRDRVWNGLLAKRIILEKIKYLEVVCSYDVSYKRPEFVERQIKEALEVLDFRKKKKRKKKLKKTA